jgi:microcystin-dependent protein
MSQSCSNCFNGCAEIVSDKCVKYTGIDIPVLGILNGDSLSYVEQTLIGFLTSTLDGSGIKIDIPTETYCTLVNTYLPTCGDITVVDILTAVVKSACDLQTQITAINATLATLNADYTIGCLTGVTASTDTHDMLQAVITKLCAVDSSLTGVINSLPVTYVQLADLDALIAAYIASQAPVVTQQYQKMVPYTVVEYYDPVGLSNFDAYGVGLVGNGFDKIYLCNGLNGTPDKRGRVAVGVIENVPGAPLSPVVNPSSNPAFNLNYALGLPYGANSTTLTLQQIPSHNHTAVNTTIEPNGGLGHSHTIPNSDDQTGSGKVTVGASTAAGTVSTDRTPSGVTIQTVISQSGGDGAHTNLQPVLACYYIMYIP